MGVVTKYMEWREYEIVKDHYVGVVTKYMKWPLYIYTTISYSPYSMSFISNPYHVLSHQPHTWSFNISYSPYSMYLVISPTHGPLIYPIHPISYP